MPLTDIHLTQHDRSYADAKLEVIVSLETRTVIKPVSPIIFLHIPKTGGTNLVFLSEALHARFESFKAHRFATPRIPQQSPNRIFPHWQGGLSQALATLDEKPDFCDNLDFISGHFPFGLHEKINTTAKYVGLVRDPIERAISTTNFDYQRGYVSAENALQYLMHDEIDNPQVRALAGSTYLDGVCDEKTLEIAKANIEKHFLLLGITEETNTFIQALVSIKHWGAIALSKSQVTGDKVILHLSHEKIAQLTIKHQFDIALYTWAKARWLQWKQDNLTAIPQLNQDGDKILCITHEFASTKQPYFWDSSEVTAYNLKTKQALVLVEQRHTQGRITPQSIPVDNKASQYKFWGGLGLLAIGLGLFAFSKFKAKHAEAHHKPSPINPSGMF